MSRLSLAGRHAVASRALLAAACFALSASAQDTASRVDPALKEEPVVTVVRQGRVLAITHPGTYTVLGVAAGHTIYRAAGGTLFRLESKSGAVILLASDTKYIRLANGTEPVTILEIDAKGNVLLKNTTGVAFYLNGKTGARVFVKWPK